MKTFCGPNGYCRPFNAEEGMSCKFGNINLFLLFYFVRCDFGYRGTECEIRQVSNQKIKYFFAIQGSVQTKSMSGRDCMR
jgi:hypothetical protein